MTRPINYGISDRLYDMITSHNKHQEEYHQKIDLTNNMIVKIYYSVVSWIENLYSDHMVHSLVRRNITQATDERVECFLNNYQELLGYLSQTQQHKLIDSHLELLAQKTGIFALYIAKAHSDRLHLKDPVIESKTDPYKPDKTALKTAAESAIDPLLARCDKEYWRNLRVTIDSLDLVDEDLHILFEERMWRPGTSWGSLWSGSAQHVTWDVTPLRGIQETETSWRGGSHLLSRVKHDHLEDRIIAIPYLATLKTTEAPQEAKESSWRYLYCILQTTHHDSAIAIAHELQELFHTWTPSTPPSKSDLWMFEVHSLLTTHYQHAIPLSDAAKLAATPETLAAAKKQTLPTLCCFLQTFRESSTLAITEELQETFRTWTPSANPSDYDLWMFEVHSLLTNHYHIEIPLSDEVNLAATPETLAAAREQLLKEVYNTLQTAPIEPFVPRLEELFRSWEPSTPLSKSDLWMLEINKLIEDHDIRSIVWSEKARNNPIIQELQTKIKITENDDITTIEFLNTKPKLTIPVAPAICKAITDRLGTGSLQVYLEFIAAALPQEEDVEQTTRTVKVMLTALSKIRSVTRDRIGHDMFNRFIQNMLQIIPSIPDDSDPSNAIKTMAESMATIIEMDASIAEAKNRQIHRMEEVPNTLDHFMQTMVRAIPFMNNEIDLSQAISRLGQLLGLCVYWRNEIHIDDDGLVTIKYKFFGKTFNVPLQGEITKIPYSNMLALDTTLPTETYAALTKEPVTDCKETMHSLVAAMQKIQRGEEMSQAEIMTMLEAARLSQPPEPSSDIATVA